MIGSSHIFGTESTTTMAFAAKHKRHTSVTSAKRGQKEICTHCKYHGHTMGKCYTLHGYPPGCKQRQKTYTNSNTSAIVKQVTTLEDQNDRDMLLLEVAFKILIILNSTTS